MLPNLSVKVSDTTCLEEENMSLGKIRNGGSKSRIFINLSLVFATIIVCMIGAEIAGRVLYRHRSFGPRPYPYTYHDTLGWLGKPGFNEKLFDWSREGVTYDMNAWGLRGKLPPLPPNSPGKRRVLFLGDSFLDGLGVETWERASDLIQEADSSLVVYNVSSGGWSTDQELLALRKFGPAMQPQLILLFFCLNDMPYNESNYAYGIAKPYYEVGRDSVLRLMNVPVPRRSTFASLMMWFRDHSIWGARFFAFIDYHNVLGEWVLPNPVRHRIGVPGIEQRYPNFDRLLAFADSYKIGQTTYFLLRDIAVECRRLEADLVLFTVPSNSEWTGTRDGSPAEIHRVLAWCRELNIPTVDLFPVFRDEYLETRSRLFLPDDMHWNAAGNRVVADTVLGVIRTPPAGMQSISFYSAPESESH